MVTSVEGDVRLTQGSAPARAVKLGDAIVEGDLLSSGANSEAQIKMQDSGFIVLRPNSEFKVVSYKADGEDDDGGVIQLVKGGFRSITGWIGRYNTQRYLVQTPTATIGIRGTDHEPHVIAEGSDEGEPGTYDRVYAGQTYIQTGDGQTTVTPDQSAFVSSRAHARPSLLASIPGFFKPGPHEAEINKKHAEIQQQIDMRREERRNLLKQERAALAASRQQTKALRDQTKTETEQSRQAAQQLRQQMQQKREALKQDSQANLELMKQLKEKRDALQADAQAGKLTRQEMRQRRQELQEQFKQAHQAQEDLKQRRTELEQSEDQAVDQNYEAAQARLQALHDQQLKTREQRNEMDQQRDSTQEDIKNMQQQENQRYRQELKTDRKQGKAAAPDNSGGTTDDSSGQ
jgi:hypothetical protein